MNKLETLAMVDVAEHLLKESKEPMELKTLFKEIAEIKEISLDDVDKLTQLYMDITQSGKFVYCGDDKWDLKIGNLELWDDDGSSFIEVEEEVEEEEELEFIDFVIEEEDDEDEEEDLDEETKKELEEEKEYIEVELPLESTDDDDKEFDAESFEDEDDYNKIMDDYEDMYDDE